MQEKWPADDHIAEATEAYNARPHEAVHAAPEDVETQPATQFRVLQDNADKFLHNKKLTESRQRRLQEAGAFRAPLDARRSFEPRYGAAKELAGYDSMTARATDGTEALLKHALPVPRGSREPVATWGAASGAAAAGFQRAAKGRRKGREGLQGA